METTRDVQSKRADWFPRFIRLLTEPSPTVTGLRSIMRARFMSGLSLIGIPIFIIVEQVNEPYLPVPLFYFMSVLILVGYALARTNHLSSSFVIYIGCFAVYPYALLALKGMWTDADAFVMVFWTAVTLLIGGYLLTPRAEGALIVGSNVAFLLVLLLHPNVTLLWSFGIHMSILPLIGMSILVFAGSWAREKYVLLIEQKNVQLAVREKELDTYASLLRHDISNDLHIILLETDLAASLLGPTQDITRHLSASMAAGTRVSKLLEAMSSPTDLAPVSIAAMIEQVAMQAEIAHRNLRVRVECDEKSRQHIVRGRLLPMVFENLFRNAAAYAGKNPIVSVSVTEDNGSVTIIVSDNGPGIDPSIRARLFEKGVSTGGGSGMGLYLVKRILNLGGGSIELTDRPGIAGCVFQIMLPPS